MAKGDSKEKETGPIEVEDKILARGFLMVPMLLLEHGVSLGAAVTYAGLLWYHNFKHTGYPGHERAAIDFHQTPRTIRRHLKELSDGGFIETFQQGLGKPLGFKLPKLKEPLEMDAD